MSQKTWEILNEITGRKKPGSEINEIKINDETILENKQMADNFNTFFTSIGKEISESVPASNISPEDFLHGNENTPNLEFGRINPSEIVDIIKAFEPKTSVDIDGISNKLLKNICTEISVSLAHIFSLSLQVGVFPNKLKTSRVIPIFKSGDSANMTNYRPISLLSALSKVLEKIVSIKLVNHLELNNLLYDHQYGFQKNKSTEHNLLHAINFIHGALNRGEYAIGIFLDLKKAFDVVSHEILLKKLKFLGVGGTALQWFKSYLSNRKQIVDLNGTHSEIMDLDISVLQGSILGPILFLCFINDLWTVSNLLMLMFADDTSALKSGKNLTSLIQEVNIELNKIAIWFRANKLAVNVSKTKFIIFRNKGKNITNPCPRVIYDANEANMSPNPELIYSLERIHDLHEDPDMRYYKLLGVNLDEFLTFDNHTNNLCKKLAKSLFCINRAKNFLNKKALKTLYFALIHSHLNYCVTLLSGLSQKNKSKIFNFQKKAIRIISKAKYRDHTGPLFRKENILPYDKLIQYACTMFMHSVHHKYAPKSFSSMFKPVENQQINLRNDQLKIFDLPFPRTEKFKKSPEYLLSDIWNKTDYNKFQPNRTTFSIYLKSTLMDVQAII